MCIRDSSFVGGRHEYSAFLLFRCHASSPVNSSRWPLSNDHLSQARFRMRMPRPSVSEKGQDAIAVGPGLLRVPFGRPTLGLAGVDEAFRTRMTMAASIVPSLRKTSIDS